MEQTVPGARLIAHVDMDCFFCACEAKRNPELKGKPLIVGATGNRGVVCTASYEARKFGVFSATPISKARKLCPDGIYLPPDGSYYREQSKKVMNILKLVADDFVQVSIDEAYLEVTTLAKSFHSWEALGSYIQDMVLKGTRLSCSIGIAPCKTVAKIASDFKKPAGITVVKDVSTFLAPLPIETFPGVGKVAKKYYNACGVHTIGDLMGMDRFQVLDTFGMYGVRKQQIALGEICTTIRHRGSAKSISRERTFHEDQKDFSFVQQKIDSLCDTLHKDLRSRCFRTVSIKVRFKDFTTITRDYTLMNPSHSIDIIKQKTQELFATNVTEEKQIRLIGVKLSNLESGVGKQMTLGSFEA